MERQKAMIDSWKTSSMTLRSSSADRSLKIGLELISGVYPYLTVKHQAA